jgi:hypothetical protein
VKKFTRLEPLGRLLCGRKKNVRIPPELHTHTFPDFARISEIIHHEYGLGISPTPKV